MIVVWQSYENRRRQRAKRAVAVKEALRTSADRVSADHVFAHIEALSNYLCEPTFDNFAELQSASGSVHNIALTDPRFGDHGPNQVGDEYELQPSGERVRFIVTRNLFHTAREDLQVEFALTAAMAPGCDPIEHVIVSWPARVEPSNEQVERFTDLLLQLCHMERNQLFAVAHGDTEHMHLHIMLNRVDPIDGARRQFGGAKEPWPLDVLHRAIAVAAFQEGWPIQDRALHRADQTGCYDRASGTRVLDAELQNCATPEDWKTIRACRRELADEEAISRASRRYEWRTGFHSPQRVALKEAGPAIEHAPSCLAMHWGLARLGIRYEQIDDTAALLRFGDQSIAATAAGRFASPTELGQRFGDLAAPANLKVADWKEREFPTRGKFSLSERRSRLIRCAEDVSTSSAQFIESNLSGARQEVAEAINAEDWRGRGAELNRRRSEDAASWRASLEAVRALRKREKKKFKEWRKLLAAERLDEDFLDQTLNDASAILAGKRVTTPGAIDVPGYTARHEPGRVLYLRERELAFVEYDSRIDLHAATGDDEVRAAVQLAAKKWGKAAVSGNAEALDKIVRIAAEQQQLEIANSDLMAQLENYRSARTEVQNSLRGADKSRASNAISTTSMFHTEVGQECHAALAPQALVSGNNDDDLESMQVAAAKIRGADQGIGLKAPHPRDYLADYDELPYGDNDGPYDLEVTADDESPSQLSELNHKGFIARGDETASEWRDHFDDRFPTAPSHSQAGKAAEPPIFSLDAKSTEALREDVERRRLYESERFKRARQSSISSMAGGLRPTILAGHLLKRLQAGEQFWTRPSDRPSPDQETFRLLKEDDIFCDISTRISRGLPLPEQVETELNRWNGAYDYADLRALPNAKFVGQNEIIGQVRDVLRDAEAAAQRLLAANALLITMNGLIVPLGEENRQMISAAAYSYRSVQEWLTPSFLLQDEERRALLEDVAEGKLLAAVKPGLNRTSVVLRAHPSTPEDVARNLWKYRNDPEFLVGVADARLGRGPGRQPDEHPDYRLRALDRARREKCSAKVVRDLEEIIRRDQPELLESRKAPAPAQPRRRRGRALSRGMLMDKAQIER